MQANEQLKALQAKLYQALKTGNKSMEHEARNEIINAFGTRALAVRAVIAKQGVAGIDGDTFRTDKRKLKVIDELKT